VSDVVTVEHLVDEPLPPRPRRGLRAALERHGLLSGPIVLLVGTFGMFWSLSVMTAADGLPKYALAGVSVACLYLGLDLLTKAAFGGRLDLGLWLSVTWMVLIIGGAILAGVLPLAESKDVSEALLEPIDQRPDLFSNHPLGTDGQGLDILGGILYGARVSLTIGVGAVLIGVAVGLLAGVTAGHRRGRVDGVVSFLTDSMLAFPPLVFLLAVVAAFSPTILTVMLALAVLAIPTFIRLSRANTLVYAQREFVLAARALGERDRAIVWRELIPNVALPVASFGFLLVAAFIVAEASLSFLGLSVQRPNPTWGNMIAAGQDDFQTVPHVVFVPGTVLFLTVYALNRIGEDARRRWDPREAKV
jgi:peptide/nickel transport system permease protein